MNNVVFFVEDGIAYITINRTHAMNALNMQTFSEIEFSIAQIESRTDIGAVIITGAGDKAFVAGGDISEMANMNAEEGRKLSRLAQSCYSHLEKLPQVVIAAVNGYALGGGNELALACDIRIASENAKFGQPEVGLGVIPGFGGTQRLARLVGAGIAKELILTGDPINAQEALRIGLVNRVVPREELYSTARAIAQKVMKKGPYAVRMAKQSIDEGLNMDINSGFQLEASLWALCFASEDKREGMRAFLDKRPPEFKNR